MTRHLLFTFATFGGLFLLAAPAGAQGLLWSLPPDGTWVRYYGEYKNVQERPESNEGALELTWLSELTIKSVGTEMADVKGQSTRCRWIEFKLVKGYQSAEGIKPGPYGAWIYKVLIPENRVIGKTEDADHIPVTFIPVVKGFRKLGEREATPVTEKVLAVYPLLAPLANYKKLVPDGGASDLELKQLGTVSAQLNTGELKLESSISRSVNKGEMWLSQDVPFGMAKFHVSLIREEKDSTAPKADFKRSAEIDVKMEVVEKGTAAQSELGDTAAPAAEKAPKAEAEPATTE